MKKMNQSTLKTIFLFSLILLSFNLVHAKSLNICTELLEDHVIERVVPSKIKQCRKPKSLGKKIRLNKGHRTNLIYIDDAVDLIISAALKATEREYILAAEGVQNHIIASEFERISGLKLNAEYIDFMPGIADRCFISDIPKLNVQWTRKNSLEEMIKKLISHINYH